MIRRRAAPPPVRDIDGVLCVDRHNGTSGAEKETGLLESLAGQRLRNSIAEGVNLRRRDELNARQLIDLSRAGLTGIAVSLVNYADELPYFRDEVLPRLEKAGLRVPA